MKVLVLLCGRDWHIVRVLRDAFGADLRAQDDFCEAVSADQARELAALHDRECGHPVVRALNVRGIEHDLPAYIFPYHEHFLVVVAEAASLGGFQTFSRELESWLAWADDNLPMPYQDGYYRIQVMNNRLLNAERALSKKTAQLERTLAEVRDANNIVALLERDRLTGLYTMAGLLHHAHVAAATAAVDEPFDVIMFAVQGLRQVKEAFGHKTGEELQRRVALFATGIDMQGEVLFARADADAFYAVASTRRAFAEALRDSLATYLADYPLAVRLRPVVAVCAGNAPGTELEEACNRARMAFDEARAGVDSVTYYSPDLVEQSLRRHELLDEVPEALAEGQFKLYLQSKVDMATGQVIGAEALIRWMHPTLGFVSPGDFIPLLEREGRIYDVDRYIWEQACKIQRARANAGKPLLPISVNVARGDFYEKDLAESLLDMVRRNGIGPEAIRLEVLERAYAQDSGELAQRLAQLREAGFVIEMDDFGTGESTLAMLSEMPIDVLKLDRGFVMNGLDDPRRRIVIESVVQMAHRLDILVIVEGVETREQERYLLEMGCRYAQGFLYAKPQPADYFLNL